MRASDYDELRREKVGFQGLPSSGLIRAWLGPWHSALRKAGLRHDEKLVR